MARKFGSIGKWRTRLLWIFVLIIGVNFGTTAFFNVWAKQGTDKVWNTKASTRKLLSTVEWEKCDFEIGHARNYSLDPSQWKTPGSAYGWVVGYVLLILIVFVALAIVCDDFFVPSLEVISERLDLSEDVAGATFMAAGSSAPELFTSIAGVTVESDVGVGTIVGSAVFNLLGIVALSAAFAGKVLHLDWRPLARDSLFYTLSIACFIIFAWDTQFELYESIIMLVLYFSYIVLMKFNPQLMDLLAKCGKKSIYPRENGNPAAPYIDGTDTPKSDRRPQEDVKSEGPDNVAFAGVKSSHTTVGSPDMRRFSHTKRGQISHIAHGRCDSPHMEHKDSEENVRPPVLTKSGSEDKTDTVHIENGIKTDANANPKVSTDHKSEGVTSSTESGKSPDSMFNYKENAAKTPDEGEEEDSAIIICSCMPPLLTEVPSKPDTKYCLYNWARYALGWFLFIISFPFVLLFSWTIPNCSKPKLQKYYLVSFTMSIVWIALLSFAMVTLVGRCGCILGVDRFTMGLVIVAIGTSVPDALSSILVARDGFGDMAVSNAIGSNVFDIDLGLGLPFVISILIRGMKPVKLLNKRDQILYDAGEIGLIPHVKFGFILLIILVLSLMAFIFTRFRLNKTLGFCLVTLYVVFVVYAYIQDIYCDHGC